MASDGSCLGVCFADNHLFFSVSNPEKQGHLDHIGSIDFNFGIQSAIFTGNGQGFSALQTCLETIKETHYCSSVRILSPAVKDCWTVVPRSVYEDSSEREAYLHILMHGADRNKIEATWLATSNTENRLLLLRNSDTLKGLKKLVGGFTHTEYVAEFELGNDWQIHSEENGSYLMIHCQKNYISVSSYILGKLRGCTFIQFEHAADLPYLWNLYASRLLWMQGIHEKIYVYGYYSQDHLELLSPYWDDSGEIIVTNTLQTMQVHASEKTYGFRLESAFPAVIMSLNQEAKNKEVPHEDHNR